MREIQFENGDEMDIWDPAIPLWARVCGFLNTLTVTEGALIGEPFELRPFQIKFIKAVCDPNFQHVLLTLPRGNGKTTLTGGVGLAALIGPLMVKNSQIPCIAKDKKQASIAVSHALQFLEPFRLADPNRFSYNENKDVGVVIRNRYDNVVMEAVSADPKGKHGLAFKLALEDEPQQWPTNTGEKAHNAMIGALGKQKDGRIITLGTRPESEYHWFAKALKTGLSKSGRRAGTYAMDYSAAKGCEWDDLTEAAKANPMWEHMPELQKVIKKDIERVKQGTLSKGYYRAYRLNQGTPEGEDVEYLLGSDCLDVWKACTMKMKKLNKKHPRQGPLFASLDPGGSSSMTAGTFYFPKSQRFECFAGLPAIPDISEREKNDKVDAGDYQAAIKNNELRIFPGKETPLKQFVEWFVELCGDHIPEVILTDGYKFLAVEQAFQEVKPGWVALLEARRVGRGADGTNDVESFEKEVFRTDGPLKSHKSILMLSALKEARLTRTTTGYVGLDKSGTRARIDVIQAGILSVGAGHRYRNPDVGSRSQGIDSYVF